MIISKLNKVAGFRAMLEMTQEEFGEKLGISKQRYSAKERGIVSFNDTENSKVKEILLPYFPDITIDNIFLIKK